LRRFERLLVLVLSDFRDRKKSEGVAISSTSSTHTESRKGFWGTRDLAVTQLEVICFNGTCTLSPYSFTIAILIAITGLPRSEDEEV
jgi:hypothetical protein